MASKKNTNLISAQADELQDAIAALIANTKRSERKLNLLEIADKIKIALKYLSLNRLAETIQLSHEMVREFNRVSSLAPPVKKSISEGKIKSIDVADRLGRLPRDDQLYVAKEVAIGNLNSYDLRAIVSLRKAMPNADIGEIVKRIKKSRNIKEYVAEFPLIERHANKTSIRNSFARIIGSQHIRSVEVKNRIGSIVFDEKAKLVLTEMTRKMKITRRELIRKILSGEIRSLN